MGRIYRYQFEDNYLKNCFFSLNLLIPIMKYTFNLNHFEKMSLVAQTVLKLLTLKKVRSERANQPYKQLKSAEKYFYPTYASFWATVA